MSWLHGHCPPKLIGASIEKADDFARDLEVVKWLHEHSYEFSDGVVDDAAAKDRSGIVHSLRYNRYEGYKVKACVSCGVTTLVHPMSEVIRHALYVGILVLDLERARHEYAVR